MDRFPLSYIWRMMFPCIVLATLITAGCSAAFHPAGQGVETVTKSLRSIAVTPANANVAAGGTMQFTATGTYSDGSTAALPANAVTFASDNISVATVSSGGLATGVHSGTANITASETGMPSSPPAVLTVSGPTLRAITVTPANQSLAKGTTLQLTATGNYSDGSTQNLTTQVTWSSSSANASVSNASGSQGVVTAASDGSATINATLGASVNGTTLVAVTAATLRAIAVNPAASAVPAGKTQQFTALGTFSDGTTQDITISATWITSDSAVAKISNTAPTQGLATAVVAGDTMVTVAMSTSGTMITSPGVNLTVGPAVLSSITVTPANPSIALGTTQQFKAAGNYSDGTTQNLTTSVIWSTSAGATISNAAPTQGLAKATATGPVRISATSGSSSGNTQLMVTPAVLTALAVSPNPAVIRQGATQQFTANGTYSDGTSQNVTATVAWSAGNGTVATISNSGPTSGLATGVAGGSVAITATSGSVSGASNLTVAGLNSIAITIPNASLVVGTTKQLKATGSYSDGTTQDLTTAVTWASSSAADLSISNVVGTQGVASGVTAGNNIGITATLGSVVGNASINVLPVLRSIAVTPASVSLGLKAIQQYVATGTYSDSSTQVVTSQATWTSGDTAHATISNTGLATVVGTSTSAIAITASITNADGIVITSPPAWLSALASLPIVCPSPTVDMKLLVITSGKTEADFPAITQILDYLGTPYEVLDMAANTGGISASMLSDGACHGYFQGVIFATGGYIYTLPGMPTLTSYEQAFKVRQVNWFTDPTPDFGLNSTSNIIPATETYSANFTAAAATVFFYANTNTPLAISHAAIYLTTPNTNEGTVTPLLTDASGNVLSAILDFADGRQYLTQTFDSNNSLMHDLVLAYGLVNWVTKGVFLGDYHVYAAAQVDDFFIDDSEWVPGTPCTDSVTSDRTAPDASFLPTFRLNAADMMSLVAWQSKVQSDPLLSRFTLSLAFNGVGTTGDNSWTGLPSGASDDLTSEVQSYQAKFHWMSHTYDHPETLNGLHKSDTGGDPNTPKVDSIDLEILTNDEVALTLGLTDFNSQNLVTPGVTGLNDPNVPGYLYADGVRYAVSDTSVIGQPNNGPNPSPNVGIVNSYAPGLYEVPRHPNDIFYNAAGWSDDSAEFDCIYTSPSPFAGFTGPQILDFVSSGFVSNMLIGDMDPQMFHQPNLHDYDGLGHSLISDTYDMTFSKYEALYKLPVLSLTLDRLGQAMQNRNAYNLSGVTGSVIGWGSTGAQISISVPTTSAVPAATIPVTGLKGSGVEVYGGQNISHIVVTQGQTLAFPLQ